METLTSHERAPGAHDRPHQLSSYLFLVLAGGAPRAGGLAVPLVGVHEVQIGRGLQTGFRRSFEGDREILRVELDSPLVSTRHARISPSKCVVEDAGSRNGVYVDEERVAASILRDGAVVRVGDVAFVYRHALPLEQAPSASGPSDELPPGLRTLRPDLAEQAFALLRVARSTLSVQLVGESGTGKELYARAVHAASGRSGALVPVNCAALPPALVEGSLFGHRAGAFSGATRDEIGLVRAADGGTLFLDEVGDLSLPAQAALLRVLQEREVLPVGATRSSPVDLRVVSSTRKSLDAMAEAGTFRVDLLARLKGYVHECLPLRARREDLGLVVADVARRIDPRDTLRFEPGAVDLIALSDFPLNVRELENVLMAAIAVSNGAPIGRARLGALSSAAPKASPFSRAEWQTDEPDRAMLIALLTMHKGNIAAVARAVAKAPMQVRRWLKRHALSIEEFR